MGKKVKLGLWAIAAILFPLAVLLVGGLFGVARALGEYLRPTTMAEMIRRISITWSFRRWSCVGARTGFFDLSNALPVSP
jgi:hypothetical protein